VLKFWTENPTTPFYLIVDPSMPVSELLGEVIALLPPEKRWSATFTTQYIYIPGGVTCAGRVVLADSDKLGEAKASSRCLDLRTLWGKRLPDDPYTEAARTGQHVRISEQYTFAQDEPMPISGEAFGQVQVAGPIRHSPGVAPASGVLPPPPPTAAPERIRRMAAPWSLLLLILLQLALTILFGVFLAVSHKQNLDRLPDKAQVEELSRKVEEQEKQQQETAKGWNESSHEAKKRLEGLERALQDLQNRFRDLPKAGDVASLGGPLNDLKNTVPDKLKELEDRLKGLEGRVSRDLSKATEEAKNQARHRWFEELSEIIGSAKPEQLALHLNKPPMQIYTVKGGAGKALIRAVIVYAPHASANEKCRVLLGPGKPYVLLPDGEINLTLSLDDAGQTLSLFWQEPKPILAGDPQKPGPKVNKPDPKVMEIRKKVEQNINGLMLVIFEGQQVKVIHYAVKP
jgi:hypothetical protein